ncbi:MAG: glycosyltransferase family protein [Solirubrobacteraceae bacterium]
MHDSPSRPGSPAAARPTILHYCHHSVGLGHLVRSLAIAESLAARFRVVVCSGGRVPDGLPLPPAVELIALPPIGTGSDGRLASLDPALTLEQAWERRRSRLLSLYAELAPVAIIVELFPFGRAKFAGELEPLLEAARRDERGPRVISSVRDLLVTAKRDQQRHDDLAAERLRRYFDAVIVHGDARFARLEETFRPARDPGTPVFYSGFVSPGGELVPIRPRTPAEVLVTSGGGLTGAPLLRAAAEAHRLTFAARGLRTRLVTGPFMAVAEAESLRALARDCEGLSVERFVPDLASAMAGAAVSVSRCGYNTTLDLLRARVPSVVVPYDEGRENEQSERARRLAALGAVTVLPSAQLTPERLAERVLDAASARPPRVHLDLSGAASTAKLMAEILDGEHAARRAA